MKIAGYHHITLKDFPGNVAAICFIFGCQLRCPYCHNPNLVLFNNTEDYYKEFLEYVTLRSNMLDGVVISGGEPLMHDGVIALIKKIKHMGLKVKLDTNGINNERLNHLLKERLIDYVALDYKNHRIRLNETVGIKKSKDGLYDQWKASIELLLANDIDFEVRTTVVKELHSINDLVKMATELKTIANSKTNFNWYIQNFEQNGPLINDHNPIKVKLNSYDQHELDSILKQLRIVTTNVYLR